MTLDDLRKLEKLATPGPWKQVIHSFHSSIETEWQTTVNGEPYFVDGRPSSGLYKNEVFPECRSIDDSAAVAALRNAAPALLACAEALKALLPVAQETCKRWPNDDVFLLPTEQAREALRRLEEVK